MTKAKKKFYRVRLSPSCGMESMVVNSVRITKKWEVRDGEFNSLAVFSNVEVEEMVEKDGRLVPIGAVALVDNNKDPVDMTVVELKAFLSAHGVGNGKLNGLNKAELLEYAMRLDDCKE